MAGLDFAGAFLDNLQKQKEGFSTNTGSDRQYPYRYVFIKPDASAKLTIRLLVSKKSNAASFTYHVHKLNSGGAINCGLNNPLAPRCVLCDALANKKNLTGVDSQEKASIRSIMLGQYVKSSGYVWDKPGGKYPEPKFGETIIIGGPATLHRQITDLLLTQIQFLPQLLSNALGNTIIIGRDDKGKQITTTTSFEQIQSAQNDQTFDLFLDSLQSLEHIALFGGVSAEDYAKLTEAATAVDRSVSAPPVTSSAQPTLNQAIADANPVFTPTPVITSPGVTGPITVSNQTTFTPTPAVSTSNINSPDPIAFNNPGIITNPDINLNYNPEKAGEYNKHMNDVQQPDPDPVKVTGVKSMEKNPLPPQNEPIVHIAADPTTIHPGVAPKVANIISKECPKKYAEGTEVCKGCAAELVCPYKN